MSEKIIKKHTKKQLPAGMKPWKPGQSGNPNGRPKKGTAIADCMREYLAGTIDTEGGKITRQQALVKAIFAKAMKGGDAAQRLMLQYIDGMPKQQIDHTHHYDPTDNLSDTDLEAEIARLANECKKKT